MQISNKNHYGCAMSFEYRSPEPRDFDITRKILMTSFGLMLLFVATLSPTTSMGGNASGQGIDAEEDEEEERSTKLVRLFFSAFDTGNKSNVSQFISPQYTRHQPVSGQAQLTGPKAFIDEINTSREAFPDIRREIQSIVAHGDVVVAITHINTTHAGNYTIGSYTLPPTGNKLSYDVVHIFRIGEDGKIVEHRVIRDKLIFLIQLGVIGRTSVSPEHRPLLEALAGGITNSSRQ